MVEPVVRVALPERVTLVVEAVKVPAAVLRLFPRFKVLPVRFKVPPLKVPPPVRVRVFAPTVKVPLAAFQALVTARFVAVPRVREKVEIFRVPALKVPPVVMVAVPDKFRLVAEVVRVPAAVLRLAPRFKVLFVRFRVPPVKVPPLVNVRVLLPAARVPSA